MKLTSLRVKLMARGGVLALVTCLASVNVAGAQTPLTSSGNLSSVPSTIGTPTFFGASAGTTGSFLTGRHADWAGTFTRTGPGIASGNIGTSTFNFSSLVTGGLPPGTYVVFGDVDTGSADHETFTLNAYRSDGSQVTSPWLDVPVSKWGTPTSYPLPSYAFSAGQYFFDGNAVQIAATVGFCLRTNTQIAKIVVIKPSAFCGMGFAAPPQVDEAPPVCCKGRNYIRNETFDAGFTGFASQSAWNPGPFPTVALSPGQFTIGNGSLANQINSTWLVWDQATQNPYLGKFLIANLGGRPTETIWAQTIQQDANKVYSLCARVKALGNFPANVTLQVNGINLPTTVVSPVSGPGVWQDLSATIGPIIGTVTIKILATGRGGLAIDNIAVIETTTPSPSGYDSIGVSASAPVGGHFNVTATYPALPTNFGYYWSVMDITNNTQVSNPPSWWLETLGSTGTMNFPGYQSSNSLSGSLPGVFNVGHHYVISYGIWSKCTLWTASRWDISFNQELKSRNNEPIIKRLANSGDLIPPPVRTVQGK